MCWAGHHCGGTRGQGLPNTTGKQQLNINNIYIHLINPILVCVGLVINVVGLGDKGFQTLQGDNSTVLGITVCILLENLPSV